jgi:hypothetical protein
VWSIILLNSFIKETEKKDDEIVGQAYASHAHKLLRVDAVAEANQFSMHKTLP